MKYCTLYNGGLRCNQPDPRQLPFSLENGDVLGVQHYHLLSACWVAGSPWWEEVHVAVPMQSLHPCHMATSIHWTTTGVMGRGRLAAIKQHLAHLIFESLFHSEYPLAGIYVGHERLHIVCTNIRRGPSTYFFVTNLPVWFFPSTQVHPSPLWIASCLPHEVCVQT